MDSVELTYEPDAGEPGGSILALRGEHPRRHRRRRASVTVEKRSWVKEDLIPLLIMGALAAASGFVLFVALDKQANIAATIVLAIVFGITCFWILMWAVLRAFGISLGYAIRVTLSFIKLLIDAAKGKEEEKPKAAAATA
jgi:hypothetical protein